MIEPNSGDTHGWIRDALKARGYAQKDLARAWGVSQGSVTRFIQGEENQNPPADRIVTLASMLGITCDDLLKGLGFKGRTVIPSMVTETAMPPVGTFSMTFVGGDTVRVVMVQDVPSAVGSEIVKVLGQAAAAA